MFRWLMKQGNVDPNEMARTFNCGIGMVVVVAKDKVQEVTQSLKESGKAEVFQIGETVAGEGCKMENLNRWVEQL